jgi:AraC-like DNA-binding protein
MPGSGTRTFIDADDYQAGLRQSRIELIVACTGAYKARLTWAELEHLYLLRGQEGQPSIAFVSLPPPLVFVAFRTDPGPPSFWSGMELQSGDILFHSRGERLHQRTTGPCFWNLIALTPDDLESYGRTFFEKKLGPPDAGMVLRPSSRDSASLRRLHATACRLAETKPQMLAHRETARSLEQDLILALVTCLTSATTHDLGAARRSRARIMVRFEEGLSTRLRQSLRLPQLCELIGVTARTLRECCAEFLGVSPSRYVLLRRLKEVRIALRDADPATASVAEIVYDHGFTERAEQFAAAYLTVFSEAPSATLRRAPGSQFLGPIESDPA